MRMPTSRLLLCTAILCAIPTTTAVAQQPGLSQGDIHNPFSSRYNPLTPNSGVRVGHPYAGPTFTFYSSGNFPVGIVPWYWNSNPFAYQPNWYPPYAYQPYWPRPRIAPWFVPPPVFGPDLVPPVAANAAPAVVGQVQPSGGGFGLLAAEPATGKAGAKPRVTNAEAHARAQHFIDLGDGYFAKQSYSAASQRYKLAAQTAPDVADGWFRQAFALVALGHYDTASRGIKRGLSIDPQWPGGEFRLDKIYRDAGLAKRTHIEALAQELLRAPSSDLNFLLGVMLYCDGEAERAYPFFVRAREMAGGDDAHLDEFLARSTPADKDAEAIPTPVAQKPLPTGPGAGPVAPFSKSPPAAGVSPFAPRAPLPYGPVLPTPPATEAGRDL